MSQRPMKTFCEHAKVTASTRDRISRRLLQPTVTCKLFLWYYLSLARVTVVHIARIDAKVPLPYPSYSHAALMLPTHTTEQMVSVIEL